MQTTLVLVGLLAAFGATFAKPNVDLDVVPLQQRAFESVIEDVINKAREAAALFDPLHVDQKEVSVLGHDAQVTNVNSEGFSNFFASHISLGGFITWTLDLVLEVPKVSGSVENWKIDGDTIYGNGAASALVEDIKVSISADISILSVTLKSLKIKPSIGKADVSVTGIYNSEEMSQEISDKINHFLNDTLNNDSALHDKISQILFSIIEKIMGSMF